MSLITTTSRGLTAEERPHGSSLLTVAPEWITLLEAAYAAGVPKDRMLDWLLAGRIEHVSLLGRDNPSGFLLRTADVRAAIEAVSPVTITDDPAGRLEERATSSAPPHVNRRRFIVVLGAAATAGFIPVRALAGSHRFAAPRRSDRGRIAKNALDLKCEIENPEADAVLAASSNPERAGKPGGGGGGGTTSINSVTVSPDPVVPGGSATITIDASRRKGLTYVLSASDGSLRQDPRRPWVWTWSDA